MTTIIITQEGEGKNMEKNQNSVIPVALSMIFADMIYCDRAAEKIHIIGAFQRIVLEKMPDDLESMYVFVQITDVIGKILSESLEIRYLDGNMEVVGIDQYSNPVNISRCGILNLIFNISSLHLPRPGRLEFSLVINQIEVTQGTIDVLMMESSNDN